MGDGARLEVHPGEVRHLAGNGENPCAPYLREVRCPQPRRTYAQAGRGRLRSDAASTRGRAALLARGSAGSAARNHGYERFFDAEIFESLQKAWSSMSVRCKNRS